MRLPHTEIEVPGPPALHFVETESPAEDDSDGDTPLVMALGGHPVALVRGTRPALQVEFHDAETFDIADLIAYASRSNKHGPLTIVELIHHLAVERGVESTLTQAERLGDRVGRLMSPRRDLLAVHIIPGPPQPLDEAVAFALPVYIRIGAPLLAPDAVERAQFEIWQSTQWTPAPHLSAAFRAANPPRPSVPPPRPPSNPPTG